MQVTETLADGLKREFRVVVPASDLNDRLVERLSSLKDQVRINGFRPGKVPLHHLKRVYGKSVMAEVIEQVIADANRRIVEDKGLKLAMQPKVSLPEDEAEVQAIVGGGNDLSMTVAVEVLPTVEVGDLKAVKVERLTAEVAESDIDEVVTRIAEQNRPYSPKETGEAETGDRLTVAYKGTIDGAPFEGGEGVDIQLVIGSNTFIPGFEQALLGARAGETRTVTSAFPARYARRDIAGKDASFEVTVSGLETPGEAVVDDELAKTLGVDSLAALRDSIRGQLTRDLATASRSKVKRQLLDVLDGHYSFELPPTLVEQEFANIWRQVEADMSAAQKTFADEDTTEEAAREDYRKIAVRRVRLGLLLAQIGDANKIEVADDEVTRALTERVRQFPGQEREVWDFYRKNPSALAELRAPIFEDKVVDYILGLADVTERSVTREELFAQEEIEEPTV